MNHSVYGFNLLSANSKYVHNIDLFHSVTCKLQDHSEYGLTSLCDSQTSTPSCTVIWFDYLLFFFETVTFTLALFHYVLRRSHLHYEFTSFCDLHISTTIRTISWYDYFFWEWRSHYGFISLSWDEVIYSMALISLHLETKSFIPQLALSQYVMKQSLYSMGWFYVCE